MSDFDNVKLVKSIDWNSMDWLLLMCYKHHDQLMITDIQKDYKT